MKKILSLLLGLFILSSCLNVFADIIVDDNDTGGGMGNIGGDDTLNDDEIEAALAKPLCFNDFESCSFTASDYFSIAETGDDEHGKAFKSSYINPSDPQNSFAEIEGGKMGSTYLLDEQTYFTFNESLTANTNYILAFQYKTTDLENINSSAQGAISFAPQIPNSKFVAEGGDYRYYLPLSENWKQHAVMFNSSTATSINVKINTASSNATTWIDNYGIYKTASLVINGPDIKLDITEGIYEDGHLAKGTPFVASAPDGMTIKSAKMNGRPVELTNGGLNIPLVTGNVEIEVASEIKSLKENYIVKDNFIYVPKGLAVAEFIAKALKNETYTFTDAEGNTKNIDGRIYLDDKLTIKLSESEEKTFNFKYILDASGNDYYVVSDVVYIVDCLLGNKTPLPEDDVNGSGTLTVSDLVLVRRHILTAKE